MALSSSRLGTALEPVIESKMRTYISSLIGNATPYPDLTNFAKSLAEAIAQEVVTEIVNNAQVKNMSWAGGTFNVTGGGGGTVTIAAQTNITGGVE